MNLELGATILMVTHDAFTASYVKRILILRDGQIFTEILWGEQSRKQLFGKILDIMALSGGDFFRQNENHHSVDCTAVRFGGFLC